jgi:hypothetical protein
VLGVVATGANVFFLKIFGILEYTSQSFDTSFLRTLWIIGPFDVLEQERGPLDFALFQVFWIILGSWIFLALVDLALGSYTTLPCP